MKLWIGDVVVECDTAAEAAELVSLLRDGPRAAKNSGGGLKNPTPKRAKADLSDLIFEALNKHGPMSRTKVVMLAKGRKVSSSETRAHLDPLIENGELRMNGKLVEIATADA